MAHLLSHDPLEIIKARLLSNTQSVSVNCAFKQEEYTHAEVAIRVSSDATNTKRMGTNKLNDDPTNALLNGI